MNTIGLELKNWIPYQLSEQEDQVTCRWLFLGDKLFTEPFFDDTISVCRRQAENSNFTRTVSHIDMLPQWSETIETIPPTAIIFHISRCGSTMLSQLLGLNPANIVLSEVPFIDELLRWGFRNQNMEAGVSLVHSAINFYGAKRTPRQKQLFIKTDSWHVHFYQYLRQLYPGIPFILLYRRPDEVIRSQQKKRGMQAIPGLLDPAIFGFSQTGITNLGLDEYMAMVVASYLSAFLEILQKDTLAIAANYNEGMVNITQRIAAAVGTVFSETEMAQLQERAQFHGKNPEERFAEKAIDGPIPGYLETCFQLYEQLETLKK